MAFSPRFWPLEPNHPPRTGLASVTLMRLVIFVKHIIIFIHMMNTEQFERPLIIINIRSGIGSQVAGSLSPPDFESLSPTIGGLELGGKGNMMRTLHSHIYDNDQYHHNNYDCHFHHQLGWFWFLWKLNHLGKNWNIFSQYNILTPIKPDSSSLCHKFYEDLILLRHIVVLARFMVLAHVMLFTRVMAFPKVGLEVTKMVYWSSMWVIRSTQKMK